MEKFGLPVKTYEIIKNYLSEVKEIETVKIFGSRVKGNFKPYSDIDLVLYGTNLTEKLTLHIKSELEELPTPYKFDVVNYNDLTDESLKTSIDLTAVEF